MGKDTLKVSYLCSFIKGWDALGGLIPPFQGEHSPSLLKAAPLQALQEEIRFPHSFFSTLEAHLAKSKRCSLELGGVHATVNLFPGFLNKCFKLGSVTGSRILLRLTWQNLLHIHIQEKLLMILTIFCSECYQVCGEVQEDTQLKDVIPCHSNFSFMPDGELLASEGDWSEMASNLTRKRPFNLTSSRARSRSDLLTNGCTVQYRWVLEVAVNEEWQDCKATLLVERHDLPFTGGISQVHHRSLSKSETGQDSHHTTRRRHTNKTTNEGELTNKTIYHRTTDYWRPASPKSFNHPLKLND